MKRVYAIYFCREYYGEADYGKMWAHQADFYRNFLDKYDLINWYFDKLLAKSFEHMGQGKTVYDALVKEVYLYSGRADILCSYVSV